MRRGSVRRFPREPIALPQLATILHAAPATEFSTDCAVTTQAYVIAHAVDGLAPGTYVLDAERPALVPLRAGHFRAEAGLLGLGQELPADAAANVYWLVDLDACSHARARTATAPRSSPPRSPADARTSRRTRSASAPPASPSSTTT